MLLLFNIAADRLGIHIVVGHGLIALAVVHIGKAVCRFVDLICFGIIHTLIAESGVTLLLAHNVIAFVAVLPGGHDTVHSFVEISADLLGLLYLIVACLNGSGDKTVGKLQGIDTFEEQLAPIQKGILGCRDHCHIVRHVVSGIYLLEIPIQNAVPHGNAAEIHNTGGEQALDRAAGIGVCGAEDLIAQSKGAVRGGGGAAVGNSEIRNK